MSCCYDEMLSLAETAEIRLSRAKDRCRRAIARLRDDLHPAEKAYFRVREIAHKRRKQLRVVQNFYLRFWAWVLCGNCTLEECRFCTGRTHQFLVSRRRFPQLHRAMALQWGQADDFFFDYLGGDASESE